MSEESENTQSSSKPVPEELTARRGSASLAWRWFGFDKKDEQQTSPICRIFRKQIAVKQSATTNLFHHLRTTHKTQFEEYERLRAEQNSTAATNTVQKKKQTQQTLAETFTKKTPYDKKSGKMITNSVTSFIARSMLPIQSVEKDGFQEMLQTLDPRYNLPSRRYFSETALPKLYESCRQTLSHKLQKVTYYATTSDLWSSRTSEPYLSLTIHFVDEEWQLQSFCLQTSYFPEDHTGELIAQGLKDTLSSWSFDDEHMVCMTTDSGANVVSALRINNWQLLPCFGHRLHIAIGKFLNLKWTITNY